jgi:hypothetical protein
MKPGYKGPETEAEFVAESNASSALSGPTGPTTCLESVDHGWSLAGHWYVTIKTGANGLHGDHLVCKSKEQAGEIAEALRELLG